jgi:hypothetical protein
MKIILKTKNEIASQRGFPSWITFENYVIDHNSPVVVAQILMSAMDDVNKSLLRQSFILSRNIPDLSLEYFFNHY